MSHVTVKMSRHRDIRQHSTIVAEVEESMLKDPEFFDQATMVATEKFDAWMVENGEEGGIDYSDYEPGDENLEFEAWVEQPVSGNS